MQASYLERAHQLVALGEADRGGDDFAAAKGCEDLQEFPKAALRYLLFKTRPVKWGLKAYF